MNRELYWNAVAARDERFNGSFYYGVSTTGVYCKPSCNARRPLRENVRFFPDTGTAESAGFRSCKRCHPGCESADPNVSAVIKACETLETYPDMPLTKLGETVGISPSHLQRVFKEIIGISPKKFGEALKMESFKTSIREGSEVVDAMYDAGYGSSSRLYEKAHERMGMTPAVYRKGGKGMKIGYTMAKCELGMILVARTDKGICAVNFGDSADELLNGLKDEYPKAEISKDDGALGSYLQAILENLRGERRRLVLPLDLQATSFQLRVWEALREIPYGETVSYADIAKKLGNPKAVRAVAGACAANRVALVIPCHRVVKSNGDTSGYKWGKQRKEKLLAAEKQHS